MGGERGDGPGNGLFYLRVWIEFGLAGSCQPKQQAEAE